MNLYIHTPILLQDIVPNYELSTRTILLFILIKEIVFVVYRSEFLATDSEVRVRFPALPDFLRSSESGTGPNQPREYN
jgi:hypothetical protein